MFCKDQPFICCEFIDKVFPLPVPSMRMEESSIGVPFTQPSDAGAAACNGTLQGGESKGVNLEFISEPNFQSGQAPVVLSNFQLMQDFSS